MALSLLLVLPRLNDKFVRERQPSTATVAVHMLQTSFKEVKFTHVVCSCVRQCLLLSPDSFPTMLGRPFYPEQELPVHIVGKGGGSCRRPFLDYAQTPKQQGINVAKIFQTPVLGMYTSMRLRKAHSV